MSLNIPDIPESKIVQFEELAGYLNTTEAPVEEKLSKIYAWMDNFAEYLQSFTSCHLCAGDAASCCRNDVHITQIEAVYISRQIQVELDQGKDHTHHHRSPCSFLVEEKCVIYPYRPFNCRALHTLEAPWKCQVDVGPFMIGSALHGYGSDMLAALADYLLEISDGVRRDVRDYFSDKIFRQD
jgi:uncharacterized protein